jgi:heat shock protein HslJ
MRRRSVTGTWLAEDIGGAGVIDNLQSTLQLSEDGSVSGTGGCNNFAGKAILAGDAISFGPLAATRMACVPAVNDQEAKFFDALSKTQSWRIDATGKLELFDSAGTRLALMARQ